MKNLKAVAAEIVEALNSRDTGELTALQYAKDDEIDRVLKRRRIKRTDDVDERLMDLIGYADPFQTEDEARLYGAAADLLAIVEEIASGPDAEDCYWCSLESWDGPGHTSSCLVSRARLAVDKAAPVEGN